MAERSESGDAARALDIRSATKVGLLLLLIVCALGFGATVLSPPELIENRTGLVIMTTGAAAVMLVGYKLLSNRLSWNLLYFAAIVAVAAFAVAMFFAGPRLPYGVMVYIVIAIFASYYFSLRRAVTIIALIGLAWGLQVTLQEGNAAPVARWLYVLGIILISVAFVNSLVRAAERSAEREKKARKAEEAARLELARLNETLEARVDEQVAELERMGRLRRFLSPNLAEVVIGSEHETLLQPHRREIAVFFIDLRGFTRFASATEPEDVLSVLHAYYERLGQAFARFEATVGPLQGDGVMAYFNDPLPCQDPPGRAVEMASWIAGSLDELGETWRATGYDLGYGIGIAFGYATLGMIGFEGRQDYGPLGTVVNLASRLCDVAAPGQVLVDRRTASAVSPRFESTLVQTVEMKGFRDPVDVLQVLGPARGDPQSSESSRLES